MSLQIPSPQLIVATSPRHMIDPTPVHPLLVPLSLGLSVMSFISYNSTKSLGALAVVLSCGCGVTGAWGLWVVSPHPPLFTLSHSSHWPLGFRWSSRDQRRSHKRQAQISIRVASCLVARLQRANKRNCGRRKEKRSFAQEKPSYTTMVR